MDTIQKLASWLETPVYEEGVFLYQQLYGEGFLLDMLKSGPDAFNREKLHQALSERHTQLIEAQLLEEHQYPDSLKAELDQGGRLMDERTLLKERMRVLYNSGITQGAELTQMAFRILAIKDELGKIYGHRDFFKQYGFLPEAASIAQADPPADLLKRRNNLRTYKTKYTQELATCFDARRQAKLKSKLEAIITELGQLEQLVNLNP